MSTYECTSSNLTPKIRQTIIFNLVSFSFWISLKFDIICIQSQIDKPFQLLNFWIGDLHACEVAKVLEARRWFGIWEMICYLIFGSLVLTYMKVESEVFCVNEPFMINISIMRPFWSLGNMKFWRLTLGCKVVYGQLFYTKHLAIQHCASELYFCTLQMVECHAIK